jgi:hypothetical protein
MRFHVVLPIVVLLSFPSPDNVEAFAADAKPSTARSKKPTRHAPVPARPSGRALKVDPQAESYGGPKIDTITESHNELGQTVYSIAASQFDISPPLRDMAAAAASEQEQERELPENPRLPTSRILRSDLPDPVVQVAPSSDRTLLKSNVAPAAPTTGFNFPGVGINSGPSPPDSNGSVGGNQFVEIVNYQYQVWSLNRTTKTATSVLGPTSIVSLWSGFGGFCQATPEGDPIVLYDKLAKRWLIAQMANYSECVAVSTTQDATGSYARYAFTVPNGLLGDYPHYGVWPPSAYLLSAHGFYPFQAIFAALDRTKMIAGNSTATLLAVMDLAEGGHMPADLDGFALPPTQAPGIFVSFHEDGLYIYRLKVNFTGATISRTLQAVVPSAPASAACGGDVCIRQPGTAVTLDSLGNVVMFRAAYRNFIDHESLVVSHSVDPGVSGVESGVRWHDIRLSGNADATCPAYPCMYEEGTIADVPNGRSRWMPSIAMDGAENILLGYSTTGTSDGTDNHSIRYTGRAKTDPPGTMTAPETIIATGTANSVASFRWGDYTSMSVDSSDDCTFWYVNEYFAALDAWSTQVASATFPSGSGAGQCLASTCNTRPGLQPPMGTPTVPAANQITVNWTGIVPAPGAYAIERAEGTCGAEGLYRPLAAVGGTITSFTDTNVQGGVTYAYRVRSAADASGRCQAQLAGFCVNATATGNCSLKPSFTGAASAASAQQSNCGMTINWTPGASHCPLAPNVRYSVFRGTVPDFLPSPANRIAACISGPSSYLDTDNLSAGTTYYYEVRAEDDSSGNGGECGGNEDTNGVTVAGTPYAGGTQLAPGTWSDGGGDGTAFLQLNVAGSGDTPDRSWRFVGAMNDPGANHTQGGAYAYRNAGPAAADLYRPSSCTEMQTTSLFAAGSTVNLDYWERHQLEYHFDGVAVEYSVNGGAWNDVPAPSNSPVDGCDPADATSDWEPLSCQTRDAPNQCGFPDTKAVFTGPGSGTSCGDFVTSPIVGAYAHRCHRITGLNPSDAIKFRWRFSSDSAADYSGFYLDDVSVGDVRLPNACVPNTCAGQPDGTSCDDGNSCSINDACAGTACAGTLIVDPAETQYIRVQADKTTYVWDATPDAQRYDVVRGALGALPVGPGDADETCFDGLATPSLLDSTLPAPKTGFWYVSRAEYACGPGSFGQQSDGAQRFTATCP